MKKVLGSICICVFSFLLFAAFGGNEVSAVSYQYCKHTSTYKEINCQPTCTRTGMEYTRCSSCKSILNGRVLPKLNHSYKYNAAKSKASTCCVNGYDYYGCTGSGCTSYWTSTRALKPHSYYVIYKYESTTIKGVEVWCSMCNRKNSYLSESDFFKAAKLDIYTCSVSQRKLYSRLYTIYKKGYSSQTEQLFSRVDEITKNNNITRINDDSLRDLKNNIDKAVKCLDGITGNAAITDAKDALSNISGKIGVSLQVYDTAIQIYNFITACNQKDGLSILQTMCDLVTTASKTNPFMNATLGQILPDLTDAIIKVAREELNKQKYYANTYYSCYYGDTVKELMNQNFVEKEIKGAVNSKSAEEATSYLLGIIEREVNACK